MVARLISGLSKANVAITLAIVSDVTTEKERNRAMVRRKRLVNIDLFSISLGVDRFGLFTWFYSWPITWRAMQSVGCYLLATIHR